MGRITGMIGLLKTGERNGTVVIRHLIWIHSLSGLHGVSCSPVIKRLAEMFPDACFDYYYDESGVGFCGEERYENGKLVYIMEADLSERWYDDEDDVLPPDFLKMAEKKKKESMWKKAINIKLVNSTGFVMKIYVEPQ